MAGLSKFVESFPEDYGWVVLTVAGTSLVSWWMGYNVEAARTKYEVEAPAMYHPEEGHVFNCIQRAHQNTLEGTPNFLSLLILGGLQYPRISAGAGAFYLLSRVIYAKGYYTGDAKKRGRGDFGILGLFCLLGNTISLGFHQLRLWPCPRCYM